jgi:hypothetical protein
MQWSLWFNRVSNGIAQELAGWSWVEWSAAVASALALLCFVTRVAAICAAPAQRGGEHHV